MKIKLLFYCCIFSLPTLLVSAQQKITTEVLVIGGGASGITAGLQSARLGARTIIVESTTWLGGMVTSAGVSAFDGNHEMPSGIWAEFRNHIYKTYGGAEKVNTGWVSNTLFEPHVGDSIFKKMAAREKFLRIKYHYEFLRVLKNKLTIIGAEFIDKETGKKLLIYAKQVIDATELGDAIASAGATYDIGMEASAETGENLNILKPNNFIQDITYTATLKDYGLGRDCTIAKPIGYDPREFDGACTNYYYDVSRIKPQVDAKKMLDYGRLPNKKYMINWPGYGNDIYLNIIALNPTEREIQLVKAKQQTLRFIYFIQHELGFKNLGLADDEYPTADRLPFIPYHRESRRVRGLVRYTLTELAKPFDKEPLYRTGIAVGDYPVDQHHRKNPDAPQHLSFYPVPSYNIPLGALIPKELNGLIAAEKCISVSNAVNGTTRLQPPVMLIGQAAGTLAALAVKENKSAKDINIRAVQQSLLNNNAYIMPYIDIKPSHNAFMAIQRIGATGILKGKGISKGWANQTWFYPDSLVDKGTLKNNMEPYIAYTNLDAKGVLTQGEAIQLIEHKATMQAIENLWKQWNWGKIEKEKMINRLQLAVLLDTFLKPFEKPIDHLGHIH
ncbi:MAG: FAD-dependent oxidoreductase [Sediminibacterium sp.]|jgi:hypothetical protein|nr:FAD-dependent oxidoreductase [Chitinophagaceae bacterium]